MLSNYEDFPAFNEEFSTVLTKHWNEAPQETKAKYNDLASVQKAEYTVKKGLYDAKKSNTHVAVQNQCSARDFLSHPVTF